MSEKPNGKGSIVSLGEVRSPMKKGADLATRQDVADMIATECNKVHEYYLNQIPAFTARMIQDALMSFGLIQVAATAGHTAPPEPDAEAAQHAEPPSCDAGEGPEV